jgi:transcriptional regulator with GAF, ATPase, and Fis domain
MPTRDPLDLTDSGRIRRLEALDELLPTLAGVLDVREVFVRISEIAQAVLPHDLLGMPLVEDDGLHVVLHAVTGSVVPPVPPRIPLPDPTIVTRPWDYMIVPNLLDDPVERDITPTQMGMRACLRMPLRTKGRLIGALDFYARTPEFYHEADVIIGRRIADYVLLALSHARLADEAHRAETLQAREANLALLDELLATITDSGTLNETFDRVSAVARKVLPHDAVTLPVMMPDGKHAKLYVGSGFSAPAEPEIIEVPEDILQGTREHEIVNDVAASPRKHNQRAAQMGYGSALRVAIWLDGKLAGGLSFLSRTTGAFTPQHVLIARRIADRVALMLSRERRAEASSRADEATARAARLEARVRSLTEELDARTGYRRVVGESREWKQILTQAAQVAATDATVLLLGESGTGKEVVARFIHRASSRGSGPYVALNCAALPEHLLEAELFGYERGAFTGATQSKPGQLEQAGGGTLFLDEVGEMSLIAQAKFLRVLQEREFQRLGGTRVLRTDARVVAATNRDLPKAMKQGTFREDLYYRLNVFAIALPPLRDRRGDILPLSEAFIVEIGRGIGRPPAGISRDARKMLTEYEWPGNVRELRNILERAAILCDGGLITGEHLALTAQPRPSLARAPDPPAAAEPIAPAAPAGDLQSVERAMIELALQNARFNKSKAAKELGLTRTQLYVRMRKYGLS